MGNNVLKFLVVIFLSLGYTAQAQSDDLSKVESKVITGVYDDLTDDGYKFWVAKGKEDSIVFARALSEVLKKFDLDSDELIGKKFEITYKTITEVVEYGDEDDGDEDDEEEDDDKEEDDDSVEEKTITIHIIVKLKKLD